MEAIQIHVDGGYGIGIEYRTHVQSIGGEGKAGRDHHPENHKSREEPHL